MTGSTPDLDITIRPLTAADWPEVHAIYAAGIGSGNATFETEPPDWEQFSTAKLADHRLVAVAADDGRVIGWAAATAISARTVYRGVVENSVYVSPAAAGSGIGTALMWALIASTEAAGIWTVQSGVFPENTASLALHRRVGFRVVGTRERLGCHHGVWRDVILLERRSADP